VSEQTTLPPSKELPVPIEEGFGWAQEPIWMRWRRRNNSCICQESNPGGSARGSVTIL